MVLQKHLLLEIRTKIKMGKIKGLSKVIKNIKKFDKEAEQMVDLTMAANVNDIVLDARNRVTANSFDLGKLAQEITAQKIEDMSYLMFVGGSAQKYAPYVEFGTGNRVSLSYLKDVGLPNSYAAKFKGAGIKQVNLTARPYFFPAIIDGRIELEKDLNKELKRLTKKHNG